MTSSVAVHSEISSLRIFLEEELGLGPEAVRCNYEGRTDDLRRIYRYTLSRDAMWGIRRTQGFLFAPIGGGSEDSNRKSHQQHCW